MVIIPIIRGSIYTILCEKNTHNVSTNNYYHINHNSYLMRNVTTFLMENLIEPN